MEENASRQAKLDLLEKQIDELKEEKDSPLKCKISWTPAIWVLGGMVALITVGCVGLESFLNEADNTSFLIIKCITLVALVSAVSILTHKVIFLVSSIEQRKTDSMMSIYKEREMLVINLRKSLANKVLDSITLEDKKGGSGEKEKQNGSEMNSQTELGK